MSQLTEKAMDMAAYHVLYYPVAGEELPLCLEEMLWDVVGLISNSSQEDMDYFLTRIKHELENRPFLKTPDYVGKLAKALKENCYYIQTVEAILKIVREMQPGEEPGAKRLVFVGHPLRGDIEGNINRAKEFCRTIALKFPDVIPVCPIINFPAFLDDNVPEERQMGINYSLALMQKCDEVFFPADWGISEGCRNEYREALMSGKRIVVLERDGTILGRKEPFSSILNHSSGNPLPERSEGRGSSQEIEKQERVVV